MIVMCLQLQQSCIMLHFKVLSFVLVVFQLNDNISNPSWQRRVSRCREEEANPPMTHTKSEPPKQGCTAANIVLKNLGRKKGRQFRLQRAATQIDC